MRALAARRKVERQRRGFVRLQAVVRRRRAVREYRAIQAARREWTRILRPWETVVHASLVVKQGQGMLSRAKRRQVRPLRPLCRPGLDCTHPPPGPQLILTSPPRVLYLDPDTKEVKGARWRGPGWLGKVACRARSRVRRSRHTAPPVGELPWDSIMGVKADDPADRKFTIITVGATRSRAARHPLTRITSPCPTAPPSVPVHRSGGTRVAVVHARHDVNAEIRCAGASAAAVRTATPT